MGVALADAAADYGAEVEMVLGPVNILPESKSVKIINVLSAEAMATECIARFPCCDIAILAAAVADFTPAMIESGKIKRKGNEVIIRLKPTKDIAETLGGMKTKTQILAGFALETHNPIANAVAKLKRKNLDVIILNSMLDDGAGFGFDTNRITLIDKNNIINKFELKSKKEVARDIMDKIVSML
jgi:phosphopantothenoylcysteine decarboxylase/phosphopantothenate--cysteine ligase